MFYVLKTTIEFDADPKILSKVIIHFKSFGWTKINSQMTFGF